MEKVYYFLPALESIRDFLELGGGVLVLIAIVTVIMWTLIIERVIYLNRGHKQRVSSALLLWETRSERTSWHAHQMRERLISLVAQQLQKHLRLINTCVALCPLLGLLGTVTGMVQVFEMLAISGSGNSRLMADGVSRATIPTMAGMVAALSGVAMSMWLQKTSISERLLVAEHMTMDH